LSFTRVCRYIAAALHITCYCKYVATNISWILAEGVLFCRYLDLTFMGLEVVRPATLCVNMSVLYFAVVNLLLLK